MAPVLSLVVFQLQVSTLQYQEALLESETACAESLPDTTQLCHCDAFQNIVFLTMDMWFVP